MAPPTRATDWTSPLDPPCLQSRPRVSARPLAPPSTKSLLANGFSLPCLPCAGEDTFSPKHYGFTV
eukprot:scaffold9114_cov118-Isochrysis_galbana.AAC.23